MLQDTLCLEGLLIRGQQFMVYTAVSSVILVTRSVSLLIHVAGRM